MSKIKNPVIFSEYFHIDMKLMNKLNLFNPVLNVDTNLFIDPLLLKNSEYKVINTDAVEQYKEKFGNIIQLLSVSTSVGDIAWRSALNLLPKKEVEGTCLGYGTNSISGRGIPDKIRNHIIQTASEIVKIGIKDPDLFMLLPLFEEGIGADTISDITTNLIVDALLDFTSIMAKELDLETIKVNYKDKSYDILRNPLKPQIRKISPIILVPKDILRNLPIVTSRQEISDAASFNSSLREQVNRMLARIFSAKTKYARERAINELIHSKELLQKLLYVLKNGSIYSYDFNKDNSGLVAWQHLLSSISKDYPLALEKPKFTELGIKELVQTIIEQFKFLIEEKGLNKLLWKNKVDPHKEKVVQMMFFATAYSYCKANDIDISPEMDTGNGSVDFKFSQGFNKRVIVEIKNSYNPNIITGFTKQLEEYKTSEETSFGYYVVIDVGQLGKKLDNLYKIYNDDKHKRADIFYIDGIIKPTASKRK